MAKISVTCRLILAYTILLLICILLLASCGTKKKIVDTEIHNEQQTEKSTTEGKVKKESETVEANSSKDQKAITKENQTTKTTEEFNPDGTLNKRTTETSNKKSTDNSTKQRNSIKSTKTHLDSIITNKVYRQMIIQDKKVHSDLDKDSTWVKNLGKWGIIVALIISGSVIYFIRRNQKE